MTSSFVSTASSTSLQIECDAENVCIAWIDASALTRECMTHAVATANRLFMIAPFASVYDCIQAPGRKIDLIVYHAHDADSVSTADIVSLREAFSSTQLVVLSDATAVDPMVVKDILMQGASGFILTSQTGLQMLMSALALVASGGVFVPKEVLFYQDNAKQPVARDPKGKGRLTAREVEVLELLKHGKPNKIIAYELKLSESTVKVHIRNTMRKMGSTNRTHVAMNANNFIAARAA